MKFDRDGHWSELFTDGTGMMSKNTATADAKEVSMDRIPPSGDNLMRAAIINQQIAILNWSKTDIIKSADITDKTLTAYMAGYIPSKMTTPLRNLLLLLRIEVSAFMHEAKLVQLPDPSEDLLGKLRKLEGHPEYEYAKFAIKSAINELVKDSG